MVLLLSYWYEKTCCRNELAKCTLWSAVGCVMCVLDSHHGEISRMNISAVTLVEIEMKKHKWIFLGILSVILPCVRVTAEREHSISYPFLQKVVRSTLGTADHSTPTWCPVISWNRSSWKLCWSIWKMRRSATANMPSPWVTCAWLIYWSSTMNWLHLLGKSKWWHITRLL